MTNYQIILLGLLALLAACHQPATTTVTTSTKNIEPTESLTTDPQKYQTDSHILAQPLPNHRLTIAITAKDNPLFISNCNQHLVYGIFEAQAHKMLNDMASDACISEDIAIPAQATLSFTVSLDEFIGMDGDPVAWSNAKTYYVTVPSITIYDRNYKKVALEQSQITSNDFTLVP